MSVVTRFAPSPTGFLHIGGARTALFNWLYARHCGGKFLLRIEDTDRARSTQAAVDAILDGLNWLGLTPDEPPIYQFARADRHAQVAREMIARGTAFACYVTPAELEARRNAGVEAQARARDETLSEQERAQAKVQAQECLKAFRSPYRDGAPPPSKDAPFVVRLRAPDSGEVVNQDLVQSEVRFAASDIDDLVLLRADGTPTYMLAVVVDDHDMAITHVIRGDDHLTNAGRQAVIYQAMGWSVPAFAHIPLIHGADGAKLSKRHGALGAEAYRDLGYLPEGLLNYLARLGWSHGDDEIFSMEQAAQWFDVRDINKGASRLDLAKLDHVNGIWLRQAAPDRLLQLVQAHWEARTGQTLPVAGLEMLARALPGLQQRAQTIVQLADQAHFLLQARPIPLDANARKLLDAEVQARLSRLRTHLDAIALAQWSPDVLKAALKQFADAEGVGLGKVGPGLRAALTGGAAAPDLGDVLAWLGPEQALGRISDALQA